jgi:hypothetical protein
MRRISRFAPALAIAVLVAAVPTLAQAQTLVAPSGATASNEIGGSYGAMQTINGGGLTGTTLAATHDLVTESSYEDKFWISTAEAPVPITLTYAFAAAPTLSGVGIWNAVFDLPLRGHYTYDGAPSVFDLEVTYASGIKTYTGVTLGTTQVAGQRFDFCENLAGVSQIRFTIQADTRSTDPAGGDKNVYLSEFRGLQEATPSCVNPLPGAGTPAAAPAAVPVGGAGMWLGLSALLGALGFRRARRRD